MTQGISVWNIFEIDGVMMVELYDTEGNEGSWWETLEYALERWGDKVLYGYEEKVETEEGILYTF